MVLFSIRTSVDHGFSVFFGWLPHVLGFIAVLLIGWIVARVVSKLVARATRRAGLDRALHGGTGGNFLQRAVPHPSGLLGRIVFWAHLPERDLAGGFGARRRGADRLRRRGLGLPAERDRRAS